MDQSVLGEPLLEVAKLIGLASLNLGKRESYESEALFDPVFNWDTASKPCFQLKLNEERIYELLAGKSTAVFTVDGVVVDRWSMEASGGFRGNRLLACQKAGQPPNLRPQSLSISCNGEPIESIDLAAFGLDEPFLIFDLSNWRKSRCERNAATKPRLRRGLRCGYERSRRDLCEGKRPVGVIVSVVRSRRATQLKCGEDVVWEPQTFGVQNTATAYKSH